MKKTNKKKTVKYSPSDGFFWSDVLLTIKKINKKGGSVK
jgi:hypothetical protein